MRDRFNSIGDMQETEFWDHLFKKALGEEYDRILLPSRLQNKIFNELKNDSPELQEIEQAGKAQLSTFDSLVKDVFSACYSLNERRTDEEKLSPKVKHFNLNILNNLLKDSHFMAIKAMCEGLELPSIEACEEFCRSILNDLPELLKAADGERDCTKVLDTLIEQENQMKNDLRAMLEVGRPEQQIVKTANRLKSKQKQIANLTEMFEDNLRKNAPKIKAIISKAAASAEQKAQEVISTLSAWGNSSGEMSNTPINRDLLKKVRQSTKLSDVSRILGKYREIIANKRKNSFTYGLGEKYDIAVGNDINLCISSELALLASPDTQPLFIRKFEQKALKQYRKRERAAKGIGDIIVCIDESTSMKNTISWAKAIAFALLDIATKDRRKFALVHFASADSLEVVKFEPEQYSQEDVFKAIEHFFSGGTNFEKPLAAAIDLCKNGYENADIVFITDGECAIGNTFSKQLKEEKQSLALEITGVLVDLKDSNAGASLVPFCDHIYRNSEFSEDEIFIQVISEKI